MGLAVRWAGFKLVGVRIESKLDKRIEFELSRAAVSSGGWRQSMSEQNLTRHIGRSTFCSRIHSRVAASAGGLELIHEPSRLEREYSV